MGFPASEIDKIDAVVKARKHFEKRSQELAKLSRKGKLEEEQLKGTAKVLNKLSKESQSTILEKLPKERAKLLKKLLNKDKLESDKGASAIPQYPICDICGNLTGLSAITLNSPEQERNIPSGWKPYSIYWASKDPNDYRAYVSLPPGVVIDYSQVPHSGKVYVVCGNCRIILLLTATESGILYHSKLEGYTCGEVDWHLIEKLIQICKEYPAQPIISYDIAIKRRSALIDLCFNDTLKEMRNWRWSYRPKRDD